MINKAINLSIYLLRYFEIINTRYKVSNKINFGSSVSNTYFRKELKKSNFYLEYGAGNSTILANELNKNFISIEADKSFYRYMKKKINEIFYLDLGPTKYYSIPILPTFLLKKKIKNYSSFIEKFYRDFNKIPDLILIDGRFRVFVTLTIIKFCLKRKKNFNVKIIIDDFKYRKDYQILKYFFKIKLIGRFGIINLNNQTKINLKNYNNSINKFIYDFR